MSRTAEGLDLFTYNGQLGHKERTTSRDAATAMASKATALRERVYVTICAAGSRGMTSDEVALALGESVLAIRPRCSELRKALWIKPNGERRMNQSGLKAAVLVNA